MRDSEKYNKKPLFWNYFEHSEHRNRINKSSWCQDLPSLKSKLGTRTASLSFTLHCITTEEEQEEAICHTAEAQDASEDVEMGSEGELQD
jgi:hypothetical protein